MKERLYQSQPEKLTTSLNWTCSSPRVRGPSIKLLRAPLSNHLSYHRDRLLSLPTTYFDPFLNTNSLFRMADHVTEQVLKGEQGLEILRGVRYFFVNNLAHKELSSEARCQFNLARSTIFLALAAWMPSPPSFLGFVILLQLTKCSFFLFSNDLQRKLRLSLSTLVNTLARSALHCIAWFKIVDVTVWVRTSLLTNESRLAFHPTSLPGTLSKINPKSCGMPECLIGKTKILSKRRSCLKSQNITQVNPTIGWNIGGKENPRFFLTDLLSRKPTKGIQNLPHNYTIFPIHLCKQHKIICEEQVGKSQPSLWSLD